jgi:hypothetical protein
MSLEENKAIVRKWRARASVPQVIRTEVAEMYPCLSSSKGGD